MEWYFVRDGQAVGPTDIESLNENFRVGSLGPTDLVWQPGMDGWVPASTIPALWAQSSVPPPVPLAVEDEVAGAVRSKHLLLKSGAALGVVFLLYALAQLAGG